MGRQTKRICFSDLSIIYKNEILRSRGWATNALRYVDRITTITEYISIENLTRIGQLQISSIVIKNNPYVTKA